MFPYQPVRPAQSNTVQARSLAQLPRWSRTACIAIFIAFVLMVVQCARQGVAGLMVQSAQTEVDRWTAASPAPRMPDITRLAGQYSDSLQYISDNPWALEGLGTVDLARMRASRTPRDALSAAKDARIHFRQALSRRPTSPFLWANLALAKLYLNEIDAEFFAAMRHAEELGPWEPAVQQTTLFAGLAVWQELDTESRQAMARTIERGGLRTADAIFNIVKSYGRFDLVCAIEKYEVLAGSSCRSVDVPAKLN